MAHNINTQSLSDIISEFRLINTKDAITPESLGYILQRMADALGTAGTFETTESLYNWFSALVSAAPYLSSLAHINSDADRIYLQVAKNSTSTGQIVSMPKVPIESANSEKAGVMAASHVNALSNATENIESLKKEATAIGKSLTQLYNKLGLSEEETLPNVFHNAQIAVRIVNGKLNVYGASKLIEAGYVPYLFRHTRKRNPYRDRKNNSLQRWCPDTKGWHLYGSRYAVKVSGNTVLFSSNQRNRLHVPAKIYSSDASKLIKERIRPDGHRTVAWGRTVIDLRDVKSHTNKDRMIRLRFALGFAKPMDPGSIPITPANLVSSLAEFSIVYDPHFAQWKLSR